MTRNPLRPVRLVDGVWTTEGAVEIGGQTLAAKVAYMPPPVAQSSHSIAHLPPLESGEPRFWAAITDERRIFAAVALDGSGVWAIGDTEQEARAGAVDHRDYFRDQARSVGVDFPPPETDAAWLDGFTLVTLSGTTESLRALIKSMETGDPVAPWCPADLWDYTEPTKEP